MVDNDTEVQTKPVKKSRGLRASNTNTTLAPKSIFEAAGVQEIDLSTKHERPLVMDTGDEPLAFTPYFEEEVLGKTTPEQREKFSRALDEVDKNIAPKSIFNSGNVLEIPELVAEQIKAFKPKEVVYGPKTVAPEVKKPIPDVVKAGYVVKAPTPRFSSIGALVDNPVSVPSVPKNLEDRVTKLEGQLDGLLDRLARYNAKSSHKI